MFKKSRLSAAIGTQNRNPLPSIYNKIEAANLHLGHIWIDMCDAIHFDNPIVFLHGSILLNLMTMNFYSSL